MGSLICSGNPLEGYTDADLGPLTPSTRRSLGAYVFLLHGGAVSWSSKRQTINRTVFLCGLRLPEELGGATALNVDCVGVLEFSQRRPCIATSHYSIILLTTPLCGKNRWPWHSASLAHM